MRVKVGHDRLGRAQDVAVVVAVPGVEELAVLSHHGRLHCGGTGVQADEHAARVALELAAGHDLLGVARAELGQVVVGRKQRLEAGDLGALRVAQAIDRLDELAEACLLYTSRPLGDGSVLLIDDETHEMRPVTPEEVDCEWTGMS